MREVTGATCDTSLLVPAMLRWHPLHAGALEAITGADVATLPAHVFTECYSVLTRLPDPHRLSAATAGALIGDLPMSPVSLTATRQREVVLGLARAGVAGGAVYDGLVGATAAQHGLLLLTADRRARTTYEALDVHHQLV